MEQCNCADLTLWLVVILAFKALLVLAGGFLAWQTRKLYIPALNDTQHCVSCMFVVVVFCVAGAIVAFTATLYPSVYYGVIGGLVIFATTLILVLLFINKVGHINFSSYNVQYSILRFLLFGAGVGGVELRTTPMIGVGLSPNQTASLFELISFP